MSDMKQSLPDREWLDEQAARDPEKEFQDDERAIADHRDALKAKEAAGLDLAAAMKVKASTLEEQNRSQVKLAEKLAEQDEEELASKAEVDDSEVIRQVMLEHAIGSQTVTGTGPGNYFDFNPYHGWGRVSRHNEGGVTTGSAGFDLAARRMYPYAHATGDGSGISDDNDVTTWTKLFFAFWPRRNGHVRALVPYTTRGYYRIRADDGFFSSKEARVDLDVSAKLYQNYWGGHVHDNVFELHDDNINRNGRIDLTRSMYSGGIAVSADKWVLAEVAVRARVETEGSGSIATLNFRSADYVFVPYVRFDFS